MSGSVSLATPPAADPTVVGQKAAGLARAFAAGLPVLTGWVLPLEESATAISAGVAALDRGGPAALLAATRIGMPARITDELDRVAGAVAGSAVVRSSTIADDDGRWAGAFASYLDVGRELLPVAVRGCWASVFSRDVLARCAQVGSWVSEMRVAALIQPWLRFDAGGVARREPAGDVSVTCVAGGPAGLVGGLRSGRTVRVDPDDRVAEAEFEGGPDPAMVRAVARLARRTYEATGHDAVEWGWTGGEPVLLQVRADVRTEAHPAGDRGPWPSAPLRAEVLARIMSRSAAPLYEELVAPWALGGERVPAVEAVVADDPEASLAEARSLAAALASEVWDMPAEAAFRAAAGATRLLLGPDPTRGMEAIEGLRPADDRTAGRLLGLIDGLGDAAGPMGPRGRWAPFVFRVVRARGRELHGRPAAPGAGAGRSRWVPSLASLHEPSVASVVAARAPLPQLSPTLWHASAVVTAGGDPGAHLFEVARSLGVPAVVGADLESWRDDEALVAVDGDEGVVSVLPSAGRG